MNNTPKRGPGRPANKSANVETVEVKEIVVEAPKQPTMVAYYNMYTDYIACGKPGNLEAPFRLDRPADGRISENDLIAAGVDIDFLKEIGTLEFTAYLPVL